MRNKYYAIKTRTSDGLVFDSHKEARRWEQLLVLEKSGEISGLQRQVEYELIPNQYETVARFGKDNKRLKDQTKLVERRMAYIADFVYTDSMGELVVEDAKGYKRGAAYDVFVIKRKLMRLIHGIAVKEV